MTVVIVYPLKKGANKNICNDDDHNNNNNNNNNDNNNNNNNNNKLFNTKLVLKRKK